MKHASLIEILDGVVSAASTVLSSACEMAVESRHVRDAAEPEDDDALAGALSSSCGPLQELIVSASPGLAGWVASGVLDRKGHLAPAVLDPTVAGFRILASLLHEQLERECLWYDAAGSLERIDPTDIAGRIGTRSGFLIELGTKAGPCHVRLVLAVTDRPTTIDPATDEELIDVDEASSLLTEIIKEEVDLQLELPVARFQTCLYHGRIVARSRHGGRPVLLIAAPRLARPGPLTPEMQRFPVYAVVGGRLVQFDAITRGRVELRIADLAGLPVLAVDVPGRIEPGQRRGAFRVAPRSGVGAELEPWNAERTSRRAVSAIVRDLSFTGVGLLSQHARAAALSVGTIVRVRLVLPPPRGTLVLPGLVRHSTASRSSGATRIGIEFLREGEWRLFDDAAGRVHQFVMEEQRRLLPDDEAA